MRFSEAMLLGLPEIRFTNRTYLDKNDWDGRECMGCLVGAALYAMGDRKSDLSTSECCVYGDAQLKKHWPWTDELREFSCPQCDHESDHIALFATHLAHHYENRHMTAAEIADIFRKYEPEEKETKDEREADVCRSDAARVAGDSLTIS